MKELIINKNQDTETVCLVEDGDLIERYQESNENKHNRLEGNIYVGKVADIIPGMQAAFIDYGDNKKGFIHIKDAIPQIDEKAEGKKEIPTDLDIRKILKQNQKILIQIKKDSNDKKGAKVSTHISLPSRYVAFMPNTNIITISKKIPEGKRKEELLKLAQENVPEGNGLIIRTSAQDIDNQLILKDIQRCIKKWEQIYKLYKENEEEKLIYESENVQEKIILDLKIDRVLTNDKLEFEKIKKLIQFEEIKNLKLELKTTENLLNLYDLEKQIKKAQDRKIWLKCGGFITIDKTEALVAIDVNTGKYTGNDDVETTIFKVNKEATDEIAKQLRLRDIGGIIIIDYIDMRTDEDKQAIIDLLSEDLKSDRAKSQVEGFTKLNLMEMTRKHICSHLDD